MSDNRNENRDVGSLLFSHLFAWLKENGIFNNYYFKVISEDKHLIYVSLILFINLLLFIYAIDQADSRMENEERLILEIKELNNEIEDLKKQVDNQTSFIDFEKELEKYSKESGYVQE